METEYDDRVEEHHKLKNGGYFVKTKNDERKVDDETTKNNRMPFRSFF